MIVLLLYLFAIFVLMILVELLLVILTFKNKAASRGFPPIVKRVTCRIQNYHFVSFDFSKAFGTLHRNLLMYMLKSYRFNHCVTK